MMTTKAQVHRGKLSFMEHEKDVIL
jgi:hypothetical protein